MLIMIGPGGLLLVVPHLFAVLLSVLWAGLQISVQLNLDVKKKPFLQGHILSTPFKDHKLLMALKSLLIPKVGCLSLQYTHSKEDH
jgi:hypothetical protein